MPSPLGQAIGGIAEFLKLQRGLKQDTEDRTMRKQEFETGQELRRVQTEGATLENTRTRSELDRLPTETAQKDFSFFIQNFGPENITEDHYKAYAGNDPARLAQLPGIRQSVAAAAARKKLDDKTRETQGRAADLQVKALEVAAPQAEATAAQQKVAWDWIAANKDKDPRTDAQAYRMYTIAGLPTDLTPAQKQEHSLALARAGRTDPYAYARAQQVVAEEMQAKALPPGVSVQAVRVFEPMLLTLAQNAKVGMDRIEAMKKDLSAPERQTFYKQQGPGSLSLAEQQLARDAQRVSAALYKEADDIRVQMRKAGHSGPEIDQFVTAKLRQALSTVPKYDPSGRMYDPYGNIIAGSGGGGGAGSGQLSGQKP